MPRNPFWTDQDAALVRSLSNWQFPDGQILFSTGNHPSYEAIGSLGGEFTTFEVVDYILVELDADASYTFVATGDFRVQIAIYDLSGYLLLYTDGDDVGLFDPYPSDSIIRFKPDYSGVYALSISYQFVSATGFYGIAATKDVLDDGKNIYVDAGSGLPYAYRNLLRSDPTGSELTYLNNLIATVNAGGLGLGDAVLQLVQRADATTTVATLSYQFFTGAIPWQGGLDFLVSPTGGNPNNINSAYYQSFSLENRYINFAVNLGKLGEGNVPFTAEYGSLTLFEATKKAYAEIFGATPSDAKVQAILEPSFTLNGQTMTRAEYFELYGRDGENGIGTKAAMVGWLLAEAVKADLGVYAQSSNAFMADLWDGAPLAIDIIGAYGRPEYVFGG